MILLHAHTNLGTAATPLPSLTIHKKKTFLHLSCDVYIHKTKQKKPYTISFKAEQ